MQKVEKNDDRFLATEQDYMKQVYKRVLILAALMHCVYIFVFSILKINILVIYNTFSFLFYCVCSICINKLSAKIYLTLIHLEVIVFVSLTTVILGYSMGFQSFLVSILSLVYFCPYKKKYIPYILSIIEMGIIVILKIYSTFNLPIEMVLDERIEMIIYIVNIVGSCSIILYAAFVSNVSATVTRKELMIENQNLSNLAYYDPLTEILNRRSVKNLLKKISMGNSEEPFAIIMCDIDDFKKINDTYGHDCGDYILHEIALMMKNLVSDCGDVCRWGGEEFVMLFYGRLKSDIYGLAKKLIESVADREFIYSDNRVSITITLGICDSTEFDGVDEILTQADKRMYLGKHRGKNCIISSDK